MYNMNWKCAILAGLIFVGGASANAQTLYVDGNNGNDGVPKASNGPQSPWRTIGRAVWGSTNRSAPNPSEAVSAGETVQVASGTYTTDTAVNNRWEVVYNPVNSGASPSAPITIRCMGRCVLGAQFANSPVIGSSDKNYVKWYADVLQGHAWQITAYGRQSGSASPTQVNTAPDTGPVVCHGGTGCWVEGAEIDGGLQVDYTDNWDGIRVENCTSCTIRNNTIRNFRNADNTGNGTSIKLYGSPNAIVEHNFATNAGSAFAIKDNQFTLPQNNMRIRFNRIEGVDRCFSWSTTNEERNYIYQNVCANSWFGLFVTGGGLSNDWIINNTFVNLSASGLYPTTLGFGGRFWNNVVVNADRVVLLEGGSMPPVNVISLEHNVYFGHRQFYAGTDGVRTFDSYRSAYGNDRAAPASVEGNPMLMNPSGGDFRVNAGSAADGRGVDIADLNGNGNTNETIRAGAYITNNEMIGVANGVGSGGGGSTSAPAAPSNLRVISQ
jgi:hypothetical protein